jgi:hypothetical protein
MDIGIALLLLSIRFYILEYFEPQEASTASKYSTKAYADIRNINGLPLPVQSPVVSAFLPSESALAPPADDSLAISAMESAKKTRA